MWNVFGLVVQMGLFFVKLVRGKLPDASFLSILLQSDSIVLILVRFERMTHGQVCLNAGDWVLDIAPRSTTAQCSTQRSNVCHYEEALFQGRV